MQTIADVIAAKEAQYGKYTPPSKIITVTDEDERWEKAKAVVDGLIDNPTEALAKAIDAAIKDGIISDPELEARGAKSDKIIENVSNLKHWGYLKDDMSGTSRRTSMMFTRKIHGFECELVMYENTERFVGWYALFNPKKNVVYRRMLEKKAPF